MVGVGDDAVGDDAKVVELFPGIELHPLVGIELKGGAPLGFRPTVLREGRGD